jgi:WD40-like Beta Propeller Repeat
VPRRWPILLVVLGVTFAAPQGAGAATPPPFRTLSSFDRIAVSFASRHRVFVTARQDETTNVTTAVVASDSGPFPYALAWAPGAASFALVEQGTPDWRLRVIESPDGISHDLTTKIDVLRTNKMLTRLLYAPRWIGSGSAARILLDMESFGIASIGADGSGPTLVNAHATGNPDVALFADGHRVIVSHLSPVFIGGNHYSELYLRDLDTGAETQLTFNPGHDNRSPALSADEKRIAYVEESFQNSSDETRLRVMDIDGTHNDYLPLPGDLYYDQPAWRPDGSRIAFVGLAKPEAIGSSVGPPALYSSKPDGTDLARHTDPRPTFNPYPAANNIHSIRPGDISWGQTCLVIALCTATITLAPAPTGPTGLQSNPNLSTPASIGFLVERYRGKHLSRVGRVPFGDKAKGRARVRWNLRIKGRPLARGRYRITLRAVAGTVPMDRAKPVDLIVGAHHKLHLAKPRVG